MKKLLAVLLSVGMMLSIPMGAFALDSDAGNTPPMSEEYCNQVYEQIADVPPSTRSVTTNSVSIEDGQYLYSFEGQPIAILYRFEPQGYAIFDYENKVVLEYSTDADNPFYTDENAKYYYNGLFNYYTATDDGFQNLATGQTLTVNDCSVSDSMSFYKDGEVPENSIQANEGPVYLDNGTRFYNCNVYDNLSYFYPDFTEDELADIPGVCGSVACAIMVAHFDDYHSDLAGNGDFATDWRKTGGSSSDDTYGKYLVKEFIDYVEPDGDGSFFLNPGMSSYLDDHGIDGGCSLGLLAVYQQTKNAIKSDGSGVPLIIGTSSHYCVGTGYKNVSGKQIRVNTGYGYSSWINASTVVSTWTMFFN